jgi:competence protein ComGC
MKKFLKALLISLIVIILIVLIYGLIMIPPIMDDANTNDKTGEETRAGSVTTSLPVTFL